MKESNQRRSLENDFVQDCFCINDRILDMTEPSVPIQMTTVYADYAVVFRLVEVPSKHRDSVQAALLFACNRLRRCCP